MTIELKNRRIALIGGAGFIGHNLALSLARQGAQVEIIDGLQVNNLLTFASASTDFHNRDLYLEIINQRFDLLREAGVPIHVQDARDYHGLSRVLRTVEPQVIVHLAAVSHAGRSNKDPYSTFDHSLRTLENALDYARGGRVEHFIFFSSSMAYGNFLTAEVDEEHPLNPIGIYGALKVAGEKMVIAYQQVFDLPYTIVRPSALYGPRCVSRRVGQIFIESAMNGGALKVDGDGAERLDFTFIGDLVAGVELAITKPAARNQIFNLTYGRSRSVNELVAIIREAFPEAPVQYVERDKLMPFRGTLSIKKARELLGFAPQYPIEIGFTNYIHWYKKLGSINRVKNLQLAA
ncbi:MAG: NAD(P)-dependent oxidoreductase [Verrucomicrobia bacterium]|nr:NAD(P)-dependent oxidoreductase [Verrucomicrobiota bacterium]